MALRAVMRDLKTLTPSESANDDELIFTVTWHWVDKFQGLGYQVDVEATILWTDTGAAIATKLIDAVVARATADGQSLLRTNCFLIAYNKGT